MVNNCAACTKTIRSTQNIQCSKCANYFHAICVNLADLRKISEDVKLAWTCPSCISNEPKKDNSNTPVRTAALGDERANVITREGSRKINAPPVSPTILVDSDPLGIIASEMKLLREDVGDMKSQIKSLSDYITSRFDEYATKFRALEERETQREAEIIALQDTVALLREQLNYQTQASLKNELEIAGIPEIRDENSMHIIRVTAQKIGVAIDDHDLDYVMRVGFRQESNDVRSTSSKLPRPLVVRFVRRQKKEEFLKAAKSRHNLSSSDLGVEGVSRKLYFNERLTQENRQLFRSARQRSKEAGFKYCWTKNGAVYVRRQEGNPAIILKSSKDLERNMGLQPAHQLQPVST